MNKRRAIISYLTLGVSDLNKMQSFYSGLGFELRANNSHSPDHPCVMYGLGSLILVLYPKQLLAKQAGIKINKNEHNRSSSISLNVDSKESVDDYLVQAKELNAIVTKEGFEPAWGGYCGYFKDPEENLWEVVWHEKYQFSE